MSRSGDDGKSVITDVEHIGRTEFLANDRMKIDSQSVGKRNHGIRFGYDIAFDLADICGTAELIDYRGETSNMISMTMREKNRGKTEASEFLPDL